MQDYTFRVMERSRLRGSVRGVMPTTCENCGHPLQTKVRKYGAFRFLAHFDDDARSETYAKHIPCCPGCGSWLNRGLPEQSPFYSPRLGR
jgi:hypothetical protein